MQQTQQRTKCCAGTTLIQSIKDAYGQRAVRASETTETASKVAQAFGYTLEDLQKIPTDSNLGVSCGNPIAIASLKEGEVVLDLGSGGGLDCFLAANKVGDSGRVIGVDMTPNMIELARRNAEKSGKTNVEFRLGQIEALPVEDASVDCVISNCVVNLSLDKPRVFSEVFRVLKPGGRLAISDICTKKDVPDDLRRSVMAYVGCVAGAVSADDYRRMLTEAGFDAIDTIDSHADLNVYKLEAGGSCCAGGGCATSCGSSAAIGGGDDDILLRTDLNEYAGSYKIFAVKP